MPTIDEANRAVLRTLKTPPPPYENSLARVVFGTSWGVNGPEVTYTCTPKRGGFGDCPQTVAEALGVDTGQFREWDKLTDETIVALSKEGITRPVNRGPGKGSVPATPPPGPMVYPESNPPPIAFVDTASLPVSKEIPLMKSLSIAPSTKPGSGGIGGVIGTVIGGPIGGAIGTIAGGLLGGGGASKCPGPYNFNPQTGGCDLKPPSWSGWANLGGYPGGGTGPGNPTIPTGNGGVPGAVGVTSPGEMSTVGWSTGMDQRGNVYAEPAVFSRLQRRCPPGMVLDRNGLCYRKGTPGLLREWKPGSRPILSAQDAKTLRKIASIQKRVRKAAGNAGFTCKKR